MLNSEEDWKTTNLNVESLWIIDKRDNSGKHENNYHGNFIPQIPNQLIRRYTNRRDTVLELFTGSGTTLYECENLNRNYIGFDINEKMIDCINQKMAETQNIHFLVKNCDVTNTKKMNTIMNQNCKWCETKTVDFLIAHPPYMNIVKFTDKEEDLSNIADLQIFIEKFTLAMKNGLEYLKKNNWRVSNTKTQKIEDFQPLCKAANDAKRQICKKCKETNKRWNAKNLKGNPYSFYEGNENYTEVLGCVGCYQYDPVEYRKQSVKKIAKEATKSTVDFIMKKLYGDEDK